MNEAGKVVFIMASRACEKQKTPMSEVFVSFMVTHINWSKNGAACLIS